MTVEDHLVESPSNEEIQEAVLLSPQDVRPEQGFAEVIHVVQENPSDDLEEAIPLVRASPLSDEADALESNNPIDMDDSLWRGMNDVLVILMIIDN